MKLKRLVLVGCLFFGVQGHAGLLIEPYLGVGTVASTADVLEDGVNVEDPDDETARSLGSKIGYSFLLLSAGIDYEMLGSGQDKITNTSAFVGFELPILLRFWGEYVLSSNFKDDDDLDIDFKNGYGLGVGFTGLPLVSLNLEVQTLNYEYQTGGYNIDLGLAVTTFSVSFPLDF